MSLTTSPLSTVIGVFPDHQQADSAIDELRHNNFGYDHIRLVERGTGGIFDTLKGMFTGQTAMASSTADTLTKMGMPEQDAQYYQHELDADHVLLLMNADDRPEEAFSIMRQNGAFDINSRLRMAPTNGSNAAVNRDNARVAPDTDTSPHAANGLRQAPVSGTAPTTPYTDGSQPAYRSDANSMDNASNVPPAAPDTPVASSSRSSEVASDALPPTAGPDELQETT